MHNKIGLMVGREWSLPPAFEAEVGRMAPELTVEYVRLATPRADAAVEYDAIVDRISYTVPFYRSFLRRAALRGVRVLNDPFIEHDRFTAATVAADLGLAVARSMMLPHREYEEGIVHEESLRNLDYPLDWGAVLDYVGTPCVLKDARMPSDGGQVCNSVEELLTHFNATGRRLQVVEEIVSWERFVRCFVIGRREVLTLPYDPVQRRHHVDHEYLTADLGERVVTGSLALARALGYDVVAVDWAIRDGEPVAVECGNPVPDIDIYALSPHYFDWLVERVAAEAIRAAREPASGGRAGAAPRTRAEADGAGDLAEDLPSLARDLPRSDLQT